MAVGFSERVTFPNAERSRCPVWLLPTAATDEEMLGRCRDWVELVAAGRLAEAVEALFARTLTEAAR